MFDAWADAGRRWCVLVVGYAGYALIGKIIRTLPNSPWRLGHKCPVELFRNILIGTNFHLVLCGA
jgi:hypothetical protein